MSQLGEAYLKDESFSSCIRNLEHGCMILATIETKKEYRSERVAISHKLDELFLQLVDLYLQTSKTEECQSVIEQLEKRLERTASEDDYSFQVMNELAHKLRSHDNFELSA